MKKQTRNEDWIIWNTHVEWNENVVEKKFDNGDESCSHVSTSEFAVDNFQEKGQKCAEISSTEK